MRFHIAPTTISPGRIDHAVDVHNIPRNLFRPRQLEHSRTEFFISQVIVLKLARRLLHAVTLEQILDDFWFADVGNSDDLDVVFFQREVVKLPANLP